MCKYYYRGGYCAHAAISERECVGEAKCLITSNLMEEMKKSDCSREEWYGLYCAKYQRFYCAGKENCESAESYMARFAEYVSSRRA